MDSIQACETPTGPAPQKERESGVALAMVLAAISVLSILVTEFTYIAQVNQKMAFDGLDQLKAHYLAKSGYKLSLLRLKAFQNAKDKIAALGGSDAKGKSMVPRQLLDRIWNFPFFYPIPTSIPGLSLGDKEQIEKFQKESGLEGKFSALIDSESSKYNLNLILAPFAPQTTPSPGPSSAPSPAPSAQPQFNADEARESLAQYLNQLIQKKAEGEQDFSEGYRDYPVDDLVNNISAWADPSFEKKPTSFRDTVPMKRGPFYSLTELHMIPGMDDKLYDLFSPALTVSTTPGINVNTMKEPTLRALVPDITADETKEFFKFRDSDEEDNTFKAPEDFFKYLVQNVAAFRHSEQEVNRFRDLLTKRNVRIVVDETEFKITVQAQVNQSIRLIEAWVTLATPAGKSGSASTTPGMTPGMTPGTPPSTNGTSGQSTGEKPDSGLRVTFMRVL